MTRKNGQGRKIKQGISFRHCKSHFDENELQVRRVES